MSTSQFVTPLRYPGGKGRLAQYVSRLVQLNNLEGGCYVEPYAGGAGVALSLLFLEYARVVYINDISRPIYSFWKSVLDYPNELCDLIADTPVTLDVWHKQKLVQESPDNVSTLQLGFSTFFLNRTNHSGILQGGVIGGKEQKGKWKLDARFNKKNLIDRIQRIARFRNRIRLFSMDANQFIRQEIPRIPDKALIYLDPPYYVKGGALYEHHYQHNDHQEIAQLVQESIQHPWIVSYDNHPTIRKLYQNRRKKEFGLYYSANNRFQGKELMIYSDTLEVLPAITLSRSTVAQNQ